MQKYIIGLAVLIVIGAIVFFASRKSEVIVTKSDTSSSVSPSSEPGKSLMPSESVINKETPMQTPVNKLESTTLVEGSGVGAKTGDTITVNYRGLLQDGREFDKSYGREPFTLKLGDKKVIRGWDEGLVGIKVGEKRRLVIPSGMAYGAVGVPGTIIGPNATLVFEVELVSINK